MRGGQRVAADSFCIPLPTTMSHERFWQPIDWMSDATCDESSRKGLPQCSTDIVDQQAVSLFSLRETHAGALRITDEQTRHWIGWDTPIDSLSYVRSLLEKSKNGEIVAWVACDKTGLNGHPALGVVFFEALEQPFFGAMHELNFWLHTEHWGQGWALRMADAALGWAATQTEIQRIMLSWTEGNGRSASVIRKLTGAAQTPQRVQAEKGGRSVMVQNHVIERRRSPDASSGER
jgi:RimJ/RimL family protein N-acetyltransferase